MKTDGKSASYLIDEDLRCHGSYAQKEPPHSMFLLLLIGTLVRPAQDMMFA